MPPAEAPWAVELEDFSKSYPAGWLGGRVHAVHPLSLRLAPGQVLGMVGPNGSGKSTTLKALAGLIAPGAGSCRIFGHAAGSDAARALTGYLPESPQFPPHQTGRGFLEYCAGLSSLGAATAARRVDEVLRWSSLGDAAGRRLGTYSRGMTQRLGLAQAILHEPALVLLDEPAGGLDPEGRLALNRLIRDLAARGTAVVFSSHLLAQAEEVCDRLVLLGRGRLLAAGTPAGLLGRERPVNPGPSGLEKLYLEKLRAGEEASGQVSMHLKDPRVIGSTQHSSFAFTGGRGEGTPPTAFAKKETLGMPVTPRGNDARHQGMAASLRRLRLVAGHTLGEALHQRLVLLLALAGATLVLGALALRDFNFGAAELKFIGDFGLGVIGLFGTLLAALATAQLFFTDLASRAAHCVLARPVRRWEYLAGKFAGIVALLTLFVGVTAVALAGVIAVRGSQLGAAFGPLPVFLQACALQWLKITLVAAMTLLVCSYATSALFAGGAGLLLVLVAHLRGFAAGWAWLRVWPDLGLFDAEALLAAGQPAAAAWLLRLAGYWAAYVLLFVALASQVFKRREF